MPQSLELDALCLLLAILVPKLHPVSTQQDSVHKKQQPGSPMGTMPAYNLTYLQDRTPHQTYVYRLEPTLEICRLSQCACTPTPHTPLTYQSKQLIALQIQVEKQLREEALAHAGDSRQVDQCPPGAQGLLEGPQEKMTQPSTHAARSSSQSTS